MIMIMIYPKIKYSKLISEPFRTQVINQLQ